eukprot:1181530-Prorocentrum_minimum.AAC.3
MSLVPDEGGLGLQGTYTYVVYTRSVPRLCPSPHLPRGDERPRREHSPPLAGKERLRRAQRQAAHVVRVPQEEPLRVAPDVEHHPHPSREVHHLLPAAGVVQSSRAHSGAAEAVHVLQRQLRL